MKFNCGIEVDRSVKGLIFDLDGTLVDNMHMHIQAWVDTGVKFNIPITADMITINAGIPTLQLIDKLANEHGWEVDRQAFTTSKQERYREIKANSGKINKIEPIIAIAKHYKGKLPMSVGTGSSRLNAITALKDADIFDWFDAIITADDVDQPKPHPEVFLKGAAIMGVEPKDCLVFEDGGKGIQAAKDGGMAWVDVREYL